MVSTDANGRTHRNRRNEAAVEIQPDALPNSAMSGVLQDWIVPFVADHVIQIMLAKRHYCAHNNHTDLAHDAGTQVEDRKATGSDSLEADAEAANTTDKGGTQNAQRACGAAINDGE